jgi:multicomponent K+:H+ antiporter subunit G
VSTVVPLWVDVLTAILAVGGALVALIGSFGLLRMKTFFQRVHTPTMGATAGTSGLALAIVVQASFVTAQPYVHAILVAVFVALTAPVTTVLLTRAALFRGRLRGDPEMPPPTNLNGEEHPCA